MFTCNTYEFGRIRCSNVIKEKLSGKTSSSKRKEAFESEDSYEDIARRFGPIDRDISNQFKIMNERGKLKNFASNLCSTPLEMSDDESSFEEIKVRCGPLSREPSLKCSKIELYNQKPKVNKDKKTQGFLVNDENTPSNRQNYAALTNHETNKRREKKRHIHSISDEDEEDISYDDIQIIERNLIKHKRIKNRTFDKSKSNCNSIRSNLSTSKI